MFLLSSHSSLRGIRGSMYRVMKSFVGGGCMGPVACTGHMDADVSVSAVSVNGDADAAVVAGVQTG